MRLNHASVVAFLSAASFGATASADLVTVQCTGVGAGRNVSVTQGGAVKNVFAGQIMLNLTNSSSGTLNGSWKSFCTELSQNIYINGAAQTYQVLTVAEVPIPGPAMGQARADAIARMFSAAGGAQYGANADLAAAFQVAVWEIANDYDGTAASLNLAAGNLQGTALAAAIVGNINTLFAAAANTSGFGSQLIGLGNASFQDQIIDPTAAIPTPGAAVIMGLAGLVGARRRRS
jgi:MYXO-CTERM domain-containing protein